MAEISGTSTGVDTELSSSEGVRPYTYSRSHRVLEVMGLLFGCSLLGANAWLVVREWPASRSCVAIGGVLIGLCLADWASGFVHWAADSYGHAKMPIFGGFVRTFREHHSDQLDITRHDAIETNGDVFIFSSPVHLALLLSVHSAWGLALVLGVFMGSYCNSQIHKWAHVEHAPHWVRTLQRSRFLLSPEHHAKHHAGDHESHYCITTGWMNPALDTVSFFRRAEWALRKVGIVRQR